MRQAIENYLESLKVRRYSASTMRTHARALLTFEQFLAGRGLDDARAVTGEHIREHQAGLAAQKTLATVHVHLIALRRFFEHLETTDAILVNPCVGLKLPHLPKKLPKAVLTPGEARAVLDAPDTQTRTGIRDKAILEMFYSTGIRSGEMASLTVHDVDYRHGFVRVNKGKGGKDRVAPMGKKACNYVREYLQKVRAVWTKKNRDERALWISAIEPHGPMKQQAIDVRARFYARRVLKRTISPHVWRHTCATHLVANGANIAYVQRLLGHRSLETTQRYSRVAVPEVKQTFKKHPRVRQAASKTLRREQVKAMRVKGPYEL